MVFAPLIDQIPPPATVPEKSANTPDPNHPHNSTLISLDEYRAIAETAEERLEYRHGEIFIMPGGTASHSAITCNLIIYLGFLLRDTDFRLYNSDMRIWIPKFQCGTYADVFVIQGEPEFNAQRHDEILNPLLIVEVLSASTQGYDRGEKFRKYRSLPSLAEYLLISQSEPYIEHYSRSNMQPEQRDIWQLTISDRLDQKIILPSLSIEVPLPEIYRRIAGIE
ncbi:MAG: Uma2 family endonuclease [Coleofasciculaceae cyanobacterium SM2_1_6]|nr:Uma2 family endonuclease [Coleofasciculaceae cyanobacterium SM2_1_6]